MSILRYLPGRARAPALLGLAAAVLVGSACQGLTDSPRGGQGVRLLWRTPLDRPDRGFHYPAGDAERSYALLGGVVAYDAGTGKLAWRSPLSQYMPRNVVHRDGRVLTAETVAFAFDAATGRELWRFRPDSSADFAQSAVDDRAFYVGTRSRRVYALGLADGRSLWSTDIGPDWPFGGIVSGISVSGDTVYATAEKGYAANNHIASGWIVALDRSSGRVLWRYENGRGADLRNFISAPTVAGRLLLASDRKGNAVVAVDRFTGQEVWRVNGAAGYIGFTSPPVAVGDIVYAASGDTHVYAIDLGSGRVQWKTALPGAVEAVTVCGDYVVANFRGIAVLERQSGKLLTKMYDSDDEFTTSGFAVGGRRVFVLGNKAAYALGCE